MIFSFKSFIRIRKMRKFFSEQVVMKLESASSYTLGGFVGQEVKIRFLETCLQIYPENVDDSKSKRSFIISDITEIKIEEDQMVLNARGAQYKFKKYRNEGR